MPILNLNLLKKYRFRTHGCRAAPYAFQGCSNERPNFLKKNYMHNYFQTNMICLNIKHPNLRIPRIWI